MLLLNYNAPNRWKVQVSRYKARSRASVPLLTKDSQIGANLRVCADEENRADYPDRMIFDLDPAPDVPFDALKLAAQDVRQRLKQRGLESSLKCTGGKGLHVTVALGGKDKWPAVKHFAGDFAS